MTGHISQGQLSEWLDGQLPDAEERLVEEHIRACEACHFLEREMSTVTRLFREAQSLTPPPALWARIANELQKSEHSTFSRLKPHSWMNFIRGGIGWPAWLQVRALVPAAALILILIVGGSLTLQQYRSDVRRTVAAVAEIDRARAALFAENLPTYNPFHSTAELDPGRNPFSVSQTGSGPNPFRPLLSSSPEEGLK